MLHFAPEPALSSRFATLEHLDYVTVDIEDSSTTVRADITDLPFADESFDVVYCSHVLEHVTDDRRAMRECCRILRHAGWAVFLVPICATTTFEDPSVTDPKVREQLFGQKDHVRNYGPDFADRLLASGFLVTVYQVADVAGDKLSEYGIRPADGPLFYCTRQ